MTDDTSIPLVAFAITIASSLRSLDSMPASLRLDHVDFGIRTAFRLRHRRVYAPNPFRPDECLVSRPRSRDEVADLRALISDLVPFQAAAIACALIVYLGIPVLAARMPLLPVLVASFAASGTVVMAAFVTSAIRGTTRLDRMATARIIAAAIISPPVAVNLARDVAWARRAGS